jgi:hypothetical protein
MTSTATDLTVAAWPGCAPRLLRLHRRQRRLRRICAGGGYRRVIDADALLAVDLSDCSDVAARRFQWEQAAPCGMPVTRRRHGCRRERRRGRTIGEGSPALRNRPHLVLDGLRIASAIVEQAVRMCTSPTNNRPPRWQVQSVNSGPRRSARPVNVVTVEPTYVAGGETAASANQRRTGEIDRQAAPTLRAGSVGTSVVSNAGRWPTALHP